MENLFQQIPDDLLKALHGFVPLAHLLATTPVLSLSVRVIQGLRACHNQSRIMPEVVHCSCLYPYHECIPYLVP